MPSIVVDLRSSARLSYIDSGPPSQSANANTPYTTIFAVHGYGFCNAVFKKLFAHCSSYNVRIVAINRRGYPGSTPFDSDELSVISDSSNGGEKATEKCREDFFRARGVEILTFMEKFITQEKLPPITTNTPRQEALSGGVALLGWSLGASFTLSAIANIYAESVGDEMRERLSRYLRAHIMLEPAVLAPKRFNNPPGFWYPLIDTNIPSPERFILWAHLLTAYYDHQGDLPHAPENLSAVIPSTMRVPTIFNMSLEDQEEILCMPRSKADKEPQNLSTSMAILDLMTVNACFVPNHAMYQKACFDRQLRGSPVLENMKVWEVIGEKSHPIVWLAYWQIQGDEAKVQSDGEGQLVQIKLVEGVNHFMQWDDPQKTMQTLKEILDSD